MTYLQTAADFIHHRPSVGAHTACMYEASTITTSKSWAMVNCPACIQSHETPPARCHDYLAAGVNCPGCGAIGPVGVRPVCPACGEVMSSWRCFRCTNDSESGPSAYERDRREELSERMYVPHPAEY